jgi:hypothetical protein
MAALPGVLGCRSLRRTVRVRLGINPAGPRDELPGGTPILFALSPLRSVPQAGSQFRGLATAIHKTSGLVRLNGRVGHQGNVPGSFYSHGYLPLMSGTVARNSPGYYLSSLCNKVFEHF